MMNEKEYQKKVAIWAAASRFFQDVHAMLDEQKQSGVLKHRDYWKLKKQVDEEWDENMERLNPHNSMFPISADGGKEGR